MKRKQESLNSFTVEVNILQKYAYKESVRDLNAQFQRMGGHVTFKHSKSGHKVKLSHPDSEYLKEFRTALFREIGLLRTEEVTEKTHEEPEGAEAPKAAEGQEEPKGPAAPEKPGLPEKPEMPETPTAPVAEPTLKAAPEHAPQEARYERRPKPDTKFKPKKSHINDAAQPKLKGITDEQLEDAKSIIQAALEGGAIDDGMIIRYAYQQEYSSDRIKILRQVLNSSVCAYKKGCKFKRRPLKFEEALQGCCGVKERCEMYRGIMFDYYPLWRDNIDAMYQPFENSVLYVTGKISQYRHRKADRDRFRWDLLLFDTLFQEEGKDETTETRKLWIRIPEEIYDEYNEQYEFRREDIVKIKGTLKWYDNYCNYQLTTIQSLELVERKGEVIIKPVPKEPVNDESIQASKNSSLSSTTGSE